MTPLKTCWSVKRYKPFPIALSGRARHAKLRKVNVNKFSCPTWAKHIFINSDQCSLKQHPTQCDAGKRVTVARSGQWEIQNNPQCLARFLASSNGISHFFVNEHRVELRKVMRYCFLSTHLGRGYCGQWSSTVTLSSLSAAAF